MSPNLSPCGSSIALFYFEVGNYRAFIIDFLYEALLESEFALIVKLAIRRLVSCQETAVENYITKGEELFKRHKMVEKLSELKEKGQKLLVNQRERALNKIDKEATELLLSAERHCRKLMAGSIAYPPELLKLGLT